MKTITSFICNNDNLYFINKKNEVKIVNNIQNEFHYLSDEEIEKTTNIETKYVIATNIIQDLKDFSKYKGENNLLQNINIENIIDIFLQ